LAVENGALALCLTLEPRSSWHLDFFVLLLCTAKLFHLLRKFMNDQCDAESNPGESSSRTKRLTASGCAGSVPPSRDLSVKFILPALTEATDPYWRPIKYSLFPPLGLATLAAYLSPDDRAVIQDEHVEPLTLDDAPDVVVIQVYITNARRAYGIADHYREKGTFVCLGGLHVTSLPAEGAPHADAIFLGPGEQTFPHFLNRGPNTRSRAADPARFDSAEPLPRAEFDCGDAGMPAALRFLLQGCFLSGRTWLLHSARG
jgi:hypothetical protein